MLEWQLVFIGIYGAVLGWMCITIIRLMNKVSILDTHIKRLISHYESERRGRSILSRTVQDNKKKLEDFKIKSDKIENTLYGNGQGLTTRMSVIETKIESL